MTPFYQDDLVTLYNADCRALTADLTNIDTILTDPVWPNTKMDFGVDPYRLMEQSACLWPNANRVIIHLGCDSDPRFLSALPTRWPFFRVVWLRYSCPSYKGRLLYSGDVAYVFGKPPKPRRPGGFLMPGEFTSGKLDNPRKPTIKGKRYKRDLTGRLHPCPRRLQRVEWLVSKWVEGAVLGPFAGSGTTLAAARKLGFKAIGIEIDPKFCEAAAKRLGATV